MRSNVPWRDKWGGLILHLLAEDAYRFSELRSTLRGISAKVLTAPPRALQRDGLVLRTAYGGSERRVEYALTPLGRGMPESMEPACAWVREHWEKILQAREDPQG